MKSKTLPHIFKKFLAITLVSVSLLLFFTPSSGAEVNDRVRNIENVTDFDAGFCSTETLTFFNTDPAAPDSADMEWEMDNPHCLAYGAGVGLQLVASEFVQLYLCVDPASAAKVAEDTVKLTWQKAIGQYLSKETIKRKIDGAKKCAVDTGTCIGSLGTDVEACTLTTLCCTGVAASAIAFGAAMTELGGIYAAAVYSQKHAHVCGAQWNTWEQRPARMQNDDDLSGIPNYQDGALPGDHFYTHGDRDNSYQKYLERSVALARSPFTSGSQETPTQIVSGATTYSQYLNNGHIVVTSPMVMSIKNKEYREYIYGGVEFEDTGAEACKNPSDWHDAGDDLRILGFTTGNQRYYMRGPGVGSNYACGRFLLRRSTAASQAAYECCKQRSQETMCIEETSNLLSTSYHAFCKEGTRCSAQTVVYSISEAKTIPNYICSETFSVCPFNHKMGGGTETPQYRADGQTVDNQYKILLNHCQYLKHCVKKPDVPFIRTSQLDGGWLSSACFDLKGDSQNEYEFQGPLTPLNKTRNFSAPIAQCFKETMENMFINRAGNTKCYSPDEEPDANGNCVSGYAYKAGQTIVGQESFFQTIQDKLRSAIRMAMTVAVTIAGFMVLLSGTPWDKKTIMMFVIKISLVAYFALGTAWQDTFFTGVSSISADVSNIVMRLDLDTPSEKQDGCQFPKYDYSWQTGMSGSKYDLPAYPVGKEYLRIWDTLDCKIAKALGFGPEVSVPNLVLMIFAGLITNGLGLVFFLATFMFAFYLIALTVRALHVFLISSMAITILIYISPITITASLFKKTESIFKGWKTNLISFVLQPVVLFAYLGIVITIFDSVIIGDATFYGDGHSSPKSVNCASGDAANNSLYCIFGFNSFGVNSTPTSNIGTGIGTNSALAPLGISLPVLFNMSKEKVATIIKAAFLMFIFTKFTDKILDLAVKLLGGGQMSSASRSAAGMMGSVGGLAGAIQSRGTNAVKKWGLKGAALAGRKGKAVGKYMGTAKRPTGAGAGKSSGDDTNHAA